MSYLQPTMDAGLRSYAQGDQSLKLRAKILATQAVDRWDPTKGAALKTHVFNNMKGLQRFRNNRSSVVHIPESVRTDLSRIRTFENDYKADNGYDPSDAETADALSLSMKRIQKTRSTERPASSALNEQGHDTFAKERDPYDVWKDYVYYDLSAANKKIFEWTTGYGGSPVISKQEIAKRMKISPAAVSMRVSTIQSKLSKVLE